MLSILRIVSALLLLQHGTEKLFHFPDWGHSPGSFVLFSVAGIAGVLEVFGGSLLLAGFFTRPVAFLLSGEMAVAYWSFHFVNGLKMPMGYFPVVNHGDLAITFCFVFLYFVFSGPGVWSFDHILKEVKRPRLPRNLTADPVKIGALK
jgi:putative oxidoreductase